MITHPRQLALRSKFGLGFLSCVALLAPPPALAQECVAKGLDCCAAVTMSKGFSYPLGPLQPPDPSAGTHCVQTCVFSEKIAIDNTAFDTTKFGSVAGGDFVADEFGNRLLNDVEGTPSACGASLDEATNRVTLEPGTYLIEGICPFASMQPSMSRLAEVDGNGTFVQTLAVGTHSLNRLPTNLALAYADVANNGESTFLAHEVTFTVATDVVLQSFIGSAYMHGTMNGGYANVYNDLPNHGLSSAFGARLSVRRIPPSRAGSTCVIRETASGEFGPTTAGNG